MEIPEIKPWDPKEELVDSLKRNAPLVLLAFIVGNIAAWIYWICYVSLYKLVKWFMSRHSGSFEIPNSEMEMDTITKSATVPTEINDNVSLISTTRK